MIKLIIAVAMGTALSGCASVKPSPAPPPEIVVSAPVNMVFVEISEALLKCPDILSDVVLPAPDAGGRYLSSDIDKLILEFYQRGSACGQNMAAVREIYLGAKARFEGGVQ